MAEKTGIFVLSLDTELAWGTFDLGITEKDLKDFNNTRFCITRLLGLLEEYRLKATFAMVGHLMLDKCELHEGRKHSELVRPNFNWYQKDWFSEDPATNREQDPLWYGDDILKEIRASEVNHEIGSHSFSHIIFGDPGCSKECAESDVAECVKHAKKHELQLKSFVFPRNSEGHKDILKKYDFTIYRGEGNEWYSSIKNRWLRRALHLFDELLSLSPRTSIPYKDQYGLWNTNGSMLYLSRTGIRKLIPISHRVKKAKKGIDNAIKNGQVFHMWFHPFNLASDPKGLLMGLEQIFSYARKKIDEGFLVNYTMFELYEENESKLMRLKSDD